jgi:hypothetical protein
MGGRPASSPKGKAKIKAKAPAKPKAIARAKPATKAKAKAKAKPAARAVKPYTHGKWAPLVVELCRDLAWAGRSHADMWTRLGISEATFYRWLREKPELRAAIESYGEHAWGRVARSLYERAIGYEHEDEKLTYADGEWRRATTRKKYAPETAAALAVLRAKQPDLWKAEDGPRQLDVNLTIRRALLELADD